MVAMVGGSGLRHFPNIFKFALDLCFQKPGALYFICFSEVVGEKSSPFRTTTRTKISRAPPNSSQGFLFKLRLS